MMRLAMTEIRSLAVKALAVWMLLTGPAWGQVPNLLNYQGRLTDPSGNPSNGTFNMGFAMYDALSGGNALPSGTPWTETQSVSVTDGSFNVLLGSVTALPSNLFQGGPSDSAGPLRFLQVTVDGEALTPRRRIVSAAYVLSAGPAVASFVNFTAQLGYNGQSGAGACRLLFPAVTGGDPGLLPLWGSVPGGCGDGQYYVIRVPRSGVYWLTVKQTGHFGPGGNRVIYSSVQGTLNTAADHETVKAVYEFTEGEEIWAYGTPALQSNSTVEISLVLLASHPQ